MDRRNFLQLAALALAGKAAERVWPFRVYSIPKEIVAPSKWDQTIVSPIFDVLPVVGTILGPDGSPKGFIKITSVNGKELTCSSGVIHCKPGDRLVLQERTYPHVDYHKVFPRNGELLNLARS